MVFFYQEQLPTLLNTSAIMNVQFAQLSEPSWQPIPVTPSWQLNWKIWNWSQKFNLHIKYIENSYLLLNHFGRIMSWCSGGHICVNQSLYEVLITLIGMICEKEVLNKFFKSYKDPWRFHLSHTNYLVQRYSSVLSYCKLLQHLLVWFAWSKWIAYLASVGTANIFWFS